MAAPHLELYRGIPIPDANFGKGSDVWTPYLPNVNDLSVRGPTPSFAAAVDEIGSYPYGTGSCLVIDTTGYPATFPSAGVLEQCVMSDLSPYSIGGIAGDSGYQAMDYWWGVVARINNPDNTRTILRVEIWACNADGDWVNRRSFECLSGLGQNKWALYSGIGSMNVEPTYKWYRMVVYLRVPNTDPGRYVMLDWAGMGLAWGIASGKDPLTTWYNDRPTHAAMNDLHSDSSAYGWNPRFVVDGDGELVERMDLRFDYLTDQDKELIQNVYHWTRAGPTARADDPRWPHGTSQPALVVPNRQDTKFAFYSMIPGPLLWAQVAPKWPEVGTRWATNISFAERLS